MIDRILRVAVSRTCGMYISLFFKIIPHTRSVVMTDAISTKAADLIHMGGVDDVYKMLIGCHDIDSAVSEYGQNPLHLAVIFNRPEIVHMLLQLGADIRIQDSCGHTALHLAAMRGTANIIQMLVHANSPIGALDRNRRTAVHLVADNETSSTDAVEILIAYATDAEVLVLDYNDRMAKHYSGSREIRLLLDRRTMDAVQSHINSSRAAGRVNDSARRDDDGTGDIREGSVHLPGCGLPEMYPGPMTRQNNYMSAQDDGFSQHLRNNIMEDYSQDSGISAFDFFDGSGHNNGIPVYGRSVSNDSYAFLDDLDCVSPPRKCYEMPNGGHEMIYECYEIP